MIRFNLSELFLDLKFRILLFVPSFSLFICFRKFSSVREGAAQLHDHARGAGRGARSARRSSSGARPARSLRRRRLVQRPAHSGASQRGGGAGLVAANGRPRPTRGQVRTAVFLFLFFFLFFTKIYFRFGKFTEIYPSPPHSPY